jgi:uncharacterized repeat protein (TIGR03833 family)
MTPNHVPKSHLVVPGADVNIVLKADQRTGRQVRGTVQHVLTRGDHYRGIKVRLTDGRVGRVQSMAVAAASDFAAQPIPSVASLTSAPPESAASSRGQGSRAQYRDVRLDEPLEAAPEQIDLGAYIVPSRRKGKPKKGTTSNRADEAASPTNSSNSGTNEGKLHVATAVATCPVCDAFQGDEAAVSHHVAEHFGS